MLNNCSPEKNRVQPIRTTKSNSNAAKSKNNSKKRHSRSVSREGKSNVPQKLDKFE
jgi:hypothetical protein